MNMIVFNDDKVAINIEHIDAVLPSQYSEEKSRIYVGGSDEPFIVSKSFDEVLMSIRVRQRNTV